MTKKSRLRRIARSTITNLIGSKKTPSWLRDYWEKRLEKHPKKAYFVAKKKRK